MAMVAAREAWADAGKPEVESERLGAVVASGIGGVWTLLSAYDVLKEKGPRRIFPLTVPMLMPNGPAAAIGIEIGAKAGVHTPVSACASGAEAMAYAFDMIRSGRADVVLAGGTEAAIHPLPVAGFAAMQALSTRNDSPETASRPYDAGRDGFVLGEGAALAVLETEEHARARGATIYAELVSVGITSDAHHIAAPDPTGSRRHPRDAGGALLRRPVSRRRHRTSTRTPRPPPLVTSRRPGRSGEALGRRDRPRGGVRHEVDDRAPARRRRRTGGRLHDPGPARPGGAADDQRRRTRPRGDARRRPQGPAAAAERRVVALNNAFGFGGHNVVLAFRNL